MAKVDLGAARKQAEASGLLSSGDYLKLKEGANRMRLMSECLPHPGTYQGKPNFKWLCYVLDRLDGKVKPFFMPHTIYKALEAYQLSEDFGFVDVPMPYDITVQADGAGTKEVKYTVMPGREKPLTAAEQAALAAVKPLLELQAALKEKRDEADQRRDSPHDDTHFDPREYEDGRP
jgi:hypothetical protein